MTDNISYRPQFEPNYQLPEIVQWDALKLSDAIHAKQVSCHEVMQAYLAHIEAVNPLINAIVSLRESEQLLSEATEKDRQLALGKSQGWLHGIPQAIKDLSPTKGLRTTLGSPLFKDHIPTQDSIMVERIRNAGSIIIGKTNTPEFGLGSQTYNSVFGTTYNAYDLTKTAGGSSGGAAAALAMRLLPVADGSDMMGSLRNPAAFNNIIGFRPSSGRVPQGSALDIYGHQLATEGPMGRTVADVARLLAIQAGPDSRRPLSIAEDPSVFLESLEKNTQGLRIGWLADWQGYLPMEAGVLELCEGALKIFRNELGCEIETVTPDFDPDVMWQSWLALRQWAVASNFNELYADPAKRAFLKPEACWEIEQGLTLSALDISRANRARTAWYETLRQLFARYDFLVLPSAQVFPFSAEMEWPESIAGRKMDTYHRWMEVVVPGSLSGCPVISLPAGFNDAGLPMGIQMIGPYRSDKAVLDLSRAYECAFNKT